ncbi:MAG: hypothetical protein OXC48_03620 [Endozoicomonadaceae bacterium]|nr:hypothetical protein [Endozoicomonadaceae bacterium]
MNLLRSLCCCYPKYAEVYTVNPDSTDKTSAVAAFAERSVQVQQPSMSIPAASQTTAAVLTNRQTDSYVMRAATSPSPLECSYSTRATSNQVFFDQRQQSNFRSMKPTLRISPG